MEEAKNKQGSTPGDGEPGTGSGDSKQESPEPGLEEHAPLASGDASAEPKKDEVKPTGAAAAPGASAGKESAMEPRHGPSSRQADKPASARGLTALALLIALGALGASGWLVFQQTLRATNQQALEDRVANELNRVSNVASTARTAIDDAVAANRRNASELRDLLNDERQRTESALARQREATTELEDMLRTQRLQLQEMRSTDRADWSLAEAEYLLRLAWQRLLMTEDVDSAIALLGSADEVLRQLDDTDLLAAREAITRDLAALRAVPAVDVEGTWLRLQALADRVDGLLLFELSVPKPVVEVPPPDAGWQERLQAGIRAALDKIASFIVIRRREQPFDTLIDPQWEQLVRQNLRMQISQSQAALLAGNPRLYEASLGTTRRWLSEFFDFNQADVTALDAELESLMTVEVTREYPDIGGSLSAVRAAIDLRHAVANEG